VFRTSNALLYENIRRRYASSATEATEKKPAVVEEDQKLAKEQSNPQMDKITNIKRLLALCKPETQTLMMAMIALGFSSATTLILPAAMGRAR
jgi:hypothetical protein